MRTQHIIGTLKVRNQERTENDNLNIFATRLAEANLTHLVKGAGNDAITFDKVILNDDEVIEAKPLNARFQAFFDHPEIKPYQFTGIIVVTVTGELPEAYKIIGFRGSLREEQIF